MNPKPPTRAVLLPRITNQAKDVLFRRHDTESIDAPLVPPSGPYTVDDPVLPSEDQIDYDEFEVTRVSAPSGRTESVDHDSVRRYFYVVYTHAAEVVSPYSVIVDVHPLLWAAGELDRDRAIVILWWTDVPPEVVSRATSAGVVALVKLNVTPSP